MDGWKKHHVRVKVNLYGFVQLLSEDDIFIKGFECDRKDASVMEGMRVWWKGCECDGSNASLKKGCDPSTGCGFNKYGRWVRLDECGRVDEDVAVWTQGAGCDRTDVLSKAASRHVDWPRLIRLPPSTDSNRLKL